MDYSIDAWTLSPGDLFIAIRGERLDGHDFVPAALDAGAIAALVQAEKNLDAAPARLLFVGDTLQALQAMGAAARRLWGKSLIAITGSAGKTTTKEILAHLLAQNFRVMKSAGNLNNHIGMPLQLLKLEAEHNIAVVEMGMNHPGEIRALGKLAHHDLAIVTCVAPAHLEFFKSIAEIARAKYELIESLHSGGTAVLNADDEYVSQFGRDFHGKVLTFGIKRPADVCAQNMELRGIEGSSFELVAGGVRETVSFPLAGEHNIYNALAASAEALHRECGVYAAEKKIDVVIGVRGLAKSLSDAAGEAGVEAHFMQTADQAGEWLARELRAGDAVLLKASRGVKLERALERLGGTRV